MEHTRRIKVSLRRTMSFSFAFNSLSGGEQLETHTSAHTHIHRLTQ